jgi:hypothetical protein
MEGQVRELALLNLGIDSKLRGCDLVALKVRDVCHGDQVASRAVVMRHKTQRPVHFERSVTAVAVEGPVPDAADTWPAKANDSDQSYAGIRQDEPHTLLRRSPPR